MGGTQGERPTLAGLGPVSIEVGVELPDQTANPLLSGTVLTIERVQLMHQPFRVDPAQRVPAPAANGERITLDGRGVASLAEDNASARIIREVDEPISQPHG